jgi:hypothetical protein
MLARGLAIAAALALATTGALALADTTTIKGKRNNRKSIDIIGASAGHTSDGKLKHTIETAEPFKTSDLGTQVGMCVAIFATKEYSSITHTVCVDAEGARITKRRLGDPTGKPTVKRPSPTKLTFIFPKRAIGKPKVYFWGAEVNPGDGYNDALPSGPPYVKHRLG